MEQENKKHFYHGKYYSEKQWINLVKKLNLKVEYPVTDVRGTLLPPQPDEDSASIKNKREEDDENAVPPFSDLTFGQALQAIKEGKSVAREGWEKGVFIWLERGKTNPEIVKQIEQDVKKGIHECYTIDGVCKELFDFDGKISSTVFPDINMSVNDQNSKWSASNTDIIAEDWRLV